MSRWRIPGLPHTESIGSAADHFPPFLITRPGSKPPPSFHQPETLFQVHQLEPSLLPPQSALYLAARPILRLWSPSCPHKAPTDLHPSQSKSPPRYGTDPLRSGPSSSLNSAAISLVPPPRPSTASQRSSNTPPVSGCIRISVCSVITSYLGSHSWLFNSFSLDPRVALSSCLCLENANLPSLMLDLLSALFFTVTAPHRLSIILSFYLFVFLLSPTPNRMQA